MSLKCAALCAVYNLANTHSIRLVRRVWLTLAVLAAVPLISFTLVYTNWCRISLRFIFGLLSHSLVYNLNLQEDRLRHSRLSELQPRVIASRTLIFCTTLYCSCKLIKNVHLTNWDFWHQVARAAAVVNKWLVASHTCH